MTPLLHNCHGTISMLIMIFIWSVVLTSYSNTPTCSAAFNPLMRVLHVCLHLVDNTVVCKMVFKLNILTVSARKNSNRDSKVITIFCVV